MTRSRSFKGGKNINEFEPVEFELNGEKYLCKSAVQGAVLLEFVANADSESGGAAAGALYGFLEDCMPASEYKRLRDYLKRDDVIIDMALIGEIVTWLVQEFTSRPTQQSAPSEPGQWSPGPTSTEQHSYAG